MNLKSPCLYGTLQSAMTVAEVCGHAVAMATKVTKQQLEHYGGMKSLTIVGLEKVISKERVYAIC